MYTFARPKQLNSSPSYKKEPDFPCLAVEIAETRPDMNIRVDAFTVSEKSNNTRVSALVIGHELSSNKRKGFNPWTPFYVRKNTFMACI